MDTDSRSINVCDIHNKEITLICECNQMYCDKCEHSCNGSHTRYSMEDWKNKTLIKMDTFKSLLNNKIRVLNCIIEMMIMNNDNNKELDPIIKEIEDIIPSLSSDAT